MKTNLLFFLLAFCYLGYSQAPINSYFGSNGDEFAIIATGTIDQTPSGAATSWSFSSLTSTETNVDTVGTPDASQTADFPGTTSVSTSDNGSETLVIFNKVNGTDVSLTGAINPDFTLNYNDDNALLGSYPFTYGDSNTDTIEGDMNAVANGTPLSGPFSGSVTTTVDAYGLLNMNVIGVGSFSGNVTRIKSVQTITFTLNGFLQGTGSIEFITYYNDLTGDVVFRSLDGSITTGLGDSSFSTNEALITDTLTLSTTLNVLENGVKLYPNPVADELNIDLSNSLTIQSVKVQDINGRTVLLSQDNSRAISMKQLAAGVYVATVTTNAGSIVKKVIKK